MPDQRKRLAQLMNDRRTELGLRWADVAAAAGLSEETLRVIRRTARPVRDLTWARIEKSLCWQRGSVDCILAGGSPATTAEPNALTGLTAEEREVAARFIDLWREHQDTGRREAR